MKKIILIRHAKSAWDNPWLDDHDRPLAPRGLKDAPTMGKRLHARGIHPDLILSSTAVRALETAQIIARELDYPGEIKAEKKLYHASASGILKVLQIQSDTLHTVFLVGHNPGLNDLISLLGGSIDNLPTSGQYGFQADIIHWNDLDRKNTRFWFLDYPKKAH